MQDDLYRTGKSVQDLPVGDIHAFHVGTLFVGCPHILPGPENSRKGKCLRTWELVRTAAIINPKFSDMPFAVHANMAERTQVP